MTTLEEALDEKFRADHEAAEAARTAVDRSEHEIVPDPFRPGEVCRRWESGLAPVLRHEEQQARVSRAVAARQTPATTSEENDDAE